jgi:hypothetical protein
MTRIHIVGGPGSENAAKYLTAYTNKLIQCRRPSEVEACFYEVVTSAQRLSL